MQFFIDILSRADAGELDQEVLRQEEELPENGKEEVRTVLINELNWDYQPMINLCFGEKLVVLMCNSGWFWMIHFTSCINYDSFPLMEFINRSMDPWQNVSKPPLGDSCHLLDLENFKCLYLKNKIKSPELYSRKLEEDIREGKSDTPHNPFPSTNSCAPVPSDLL